MADNTADSSSSGGGGGGKAEETKQDTAQASDDSQQAPANIDATVQEAMSKGEASGLLNSEQLQDGGLQDKVKEAVAQGGSGPGGLLDKVMGKGDGSGGGGMSNPLSNYGNNIGNTIQDTMSPVSNVTGKGFETVGRPVGGVVEPIAGGVMKSGGAFGDAVGVGSGNMDRKNAKDQAEREEMKKEFGGKDQTAENPLGL